MKVVLITRSFAQGDGIGNASTARVRGLLDNGHEVVVLAHHAAPHQWSDTRFNLILVPGGWLRTRIVVSETMLRQLRDADLVLVEFGFHSPLNDLVQLTACPFILCYHGLTPPDLIDDPVYSGDYLRSVGQLCQFRTPDFVTGDSSFILREFQLLSGLNTVPSQVIQLFGDTEPCNANSTAFKGSLRLLCVGRIYPNKNLEQVIEAVRLLHQRGEDVKLALIGGGADPVSRRYLKRLRHLARDTAADINFLGYVSPFELARQYSQATVVVIPSLHEGFSLPAVEALIHGKPVCASKLGALQETLGDAALYFDPFDVNSLVKSLTESCDADTRASLRVNARRRASELSRSRFVEASSSLIESVFGSEQTLYESLETVGSHVAQGGDSLLTLGNCCVRGQRLLGVLHLRCSEPLDADTIALRAYVVAGGLITMVNPPLNARWRRSDDGWLIRFAVQLSEVGVWDNLVVTLYDIRRDAIWSYANPCWIAVPSEWPSSNEKLPTESLQYLLRKCFSGNLMREDSGSWLHRLKCKVANPILAVTYNVLVGPQVAFFLDVIKRLNASASTK